MVLVYIEKKDNCWRDIGVYKDTDDLTQEEYWEYSKIKAEKGEIAAKNYLSRH